MNEIWFTSDTHFGHKNILVYQKADRPFDSVEEMNEALISNWNYCVAPKDTVYHLGDFCFGKKNIDIAGRLNGNKRLIMGNHDCYPVSEYLQYFKKIFGALYWKNCILTHIPVHPSNLGSRAFLNVHGHLHDMAVKDSHYEDMNYLNVSVERNNLYPMNSDIINARLRFIAENE